MSLLGELLVGQYAPAISGVLGLGGSVALAIPTLSSTDSRRTLVRLQRLQVTVTDPKAFDAQAKPLLDRALAEIESERRWFRRGLGLLALSFAQLVAHALVPLAS
ncbi:hypothetical protein [Nitratireductor soli]|uniref:hypothetical protein n=1 Tax=Nitratireductor soli TaxID=1670619 RepID=UPI00065E92C8|nr:hypothetical protein [Nitratireductor soli]